MKHVHEAMMTRAMLGVLAATIAACGGGAATTGGEPAKSAAPRGSEDVLAKLKEAAGGARWDAVTSVESVGTVSEGGMSGRIKSVEDTRTGRSVSQYTIGPIDGASGFDGNTAWEEDAGGEVTALDGADARALARTDAWLTMRGYFFPSRGVRAALATESKDDDGKSYVVVHATPDGGKEVALWFDAQTSLLARSVEHQGQDTVTMSFDDYRDVSGVRVPFHVLIDRTDAAGRTDPRQRIETRLTNVTLDVPIADADFAMPEMKASATIADPSGVVHVPFDLVNNHIYADATIDGKPVRVLVDTGGSNVLTPESAKRLGLASAGKAAARGVGDEQVDLGFAHAAEVRLGGASLAKPVFFVIDMGAIPAVEGVDADGLVGFEMFRRFGVTIDYENRVLTLADKAHFTPPSNAHVVPFELDDRIPIVHGTLDGLDARISVDTGSRSSLTLHAPFVSEHALVAKYGAAPECVIGWGVGGRSVGRPARLGALTVGDVTIPDIAGDLYTGTKGAFANPDLSANLGGAVLKRFTVAFDYDARKMYLAPNKSFGDPDAFDRSGLWLMKDGDALKVVAVAPGSAGASANLSEGDRIARIDGAPAASQTLAEWRRRLRESPAGAHVGLALATGKNVDLVLADIIPPHAALH